MHPASAAIDYVLRVAQDATGFHTIRRRRRHDCEPAQRPRLSCRRRRPPGRMLAGSRRRAGARRRASGAPSAAGGDQEPRATADRDVSRQRGTRLKPPSWPGGNRVAVAYLRRRQCHDAAVARQPDYEVHLARRVRRGRRAAAHPAAARQAPGAGVVLHPGRERTCCIRRWCRRSSRAAATRLACTAGFTSTCRW